jgi:RNA polymerase sigma factor (sigma-70 family)
MPVDDIDLVLAARSGDRAAWAGIYDRYADRLHDFCWSVLRDRDAAADAMHDTFITAFRKLDQLRDGSRLRPWLFAIARNEALAHARKRSRAVPTEELEVTSTTAGPGEVAETEELRQLVWAAAAGLAERDRAALDLHLRQGLEGAALGEALGTSASNANVVMSRLRDQIERSLGAYLVAKRGRDDCAGLAALLTPWDGEFTPLWRKRIARHVDDCPTCDERRKRMVSPLALLAGVAVVPAPSHLRDRVLHDIDLISTSRSLGAGERRRNRLANLAVVAALLLLLGAVVARARDSGPDDAALATDVNGTVTFLPDASGPTSPGQAGTTVATDPGGATVTTRKGVTTATTVRPGGGIPTTPTTRPVVTTTTAPVAPVSVAARGPSSVCSGQSASVSASVTGGTGVFKDGKVKLHWTSGASGATSSMHLSGSVWTGSMTPSGTATWWVDAVDSAGNRGESKHQTITVSPCPQ